ncbi:MAG: PqqD family protein [Myxococcota bacterium]
MSDEQLEDESLLCWNRDAACRTIDGTAFVLLHSRMVSLNSVGSFVWENFSTGRTVGSVVDAVVEEFDVDHGTAQADTLKFIRTLLEKGMLVQTDDQ